MTALADIHYSHPFTYEIQHYLLRLPMELVPSALRLSWEIGDYLVRRLGQFREH